MKFNNPYKPYSIYNLNENSKIIIVCDHASKIIPKKYKNLGLSQKNIKRHIGWDIGALKLAKKIAKNTNSTLIYSGYSRLLIDCNRSLKSKGTFIKKSEDTIIPGNINISKNEKILRAKKYYFPYHDQINNILERKLKKKIIPIIVSIHSFTPTYLNKPRPWHIGLLQRRDKRLTSLFANEIKKKTNIVLGINQPYKLNLKGDFTIPFFAETNGLPNVLIEIRQDLLVHNNKINYWCNLISLILKKYYDHNSLKYCLKFSNKIKTYYKKENNL
jgi:predicted N-formylglutamate amidohydrolase|tara:strand:- start:197 stop:1015 length:819 start_codon:yes stop_codon:yes gene_type:complete